MNLTINFCSDVDTTGRDERTQNAIDLSDLNGWFLAFVTLLGPVSQLLADLAWIQLTGASFVVMPATSLLMPASRDWAIPWKLMLTYQHPEKC